MVRVIVEFYRWKTLEYRLKTYHLNPYQDGCYRRLIDEYMETRHPLPDNDNALARICGISLDDWMLNAASIVRAFFISHDGQLHNKHCDNELDFQDEKRRFASEKAKRAAEARHNKNNDLDATSKHDECLPMLEYRVKSIELREEKKESSKQDRCKAPSLPNPEYEGDENEKEIDKKAVVRLSTKWQLPESWGEYGLTLGFIEDEVLQESYKFKEYFTGGNGAGKRRSVKGWRQSWGNWINKASERKR